MDKNSCCEQCPPVGNINKVQRINFQTKVIKTNG